MECQVQLGPPSFEPIIVDYYDDGIAYVTCSAGHKTALLMQSSKFEILLASAATALLEGFTLEACASFSTALERFYEFALRVMCKAHSMPLDVHNKMFAQMARQSERQLGAFMALYAVEFGEPYKPNARIITFRNDVVHKGAIPTPEKAHEFCSSVYSSIVSLYEKLHAKHAAHITSVIVEGLHEKHTKVPPGMRIATSSGMMLFNTAHAVPEPDFVKALDNFKRANRMISNSVRQMQALHDQLKRRRTAE
jgi:hypothetical protein